MEKKRKRKWFYVILYGTYALCGLLVLVVLVVQQLQKHNVPRGEYFSYGQSSIGVDRIISSAGVSSNTQCVSDLTTPSVYITVKCSPDASENCSLLIHAAVIHNDGGKWGSTWEDGTGGSWNPINVNLKPGEEQTYTISDNSVCDWETSNPPKKLILAIRDQNNNESDAEALFQLSP